MLQIPPANNMKWSVQWCLTFPQGAQPIAPLGTPAVVIKGKILFIVSTPLWDRAIPTYFTYRARYQCLIVTLRVVDRDIMFKYRGH